MATVKTYLEKLAKRWPGDQTALEAIDYLLAKLEEELEVDSNPESDDEFPLPNEIQQENQFALFSDGGCRGNPGPGAWGMIAQDHTGEIIFQSTGMDYQTTNNRMELSGSIEALKALEEYLDGGLASAEVFLYSDSKYVVDGLIKWAPNWMKRGWKKADGKVPENVDLWKELVELASKASKIEAKWVRGHSGHPQNELCDRLANMAMDEMGA